MFSLSHLFTWFMSYCIVNWWLVAAPMSSKNPPFLYSQLHTHTRPHTRPTSHIHLHVIHFHLQNLYPAPLVLGNCFKSISWFTADETEHRCYFLNMIGGLQVYYWGLTYLSMGQWAYYWIYHKASLWLTGERPHHRRPNSWAWAQLKMYIQ